MLGLTIGLGIAALLLCLGGGAGYLFVKRQETAVRRGWSLLPVVVAAVDIPEDTLVTMEMMAQRSIPEQFVTASIVKPESASYIVNQRLLVPVQSGDPLLWSHFESKKQASRLFATHDLAVGATLTEHDTEERPMPEALTTPSWVKAEDRPLLGGKPLIAPFRAGDPILWTHLRPEPH